MSEHNSQRLLGRILTFAEDVPSFFRNWLCVRYGVTGNVTQENIYPSKNLFSYVATNVQPNPVPFRLHFQVAQELPQVFSEAKFLRRDALFGHKMAIYLTEDTTNKAAVWFCDEGKIEIANLPLSKVSPKLPVARLSAEDEEQPINQIKNDSVVVYLELDAQGACITILGLEPDSKVINDPSWNMGNWAASNSPYPIVVALHEALRLSGMQAMHGSCAQSLQGDTVMFFGHSGTGKSTTLFRALQAGWQGISEDTTWLDMASWQVYSLDVGVRVYQADLEHLEPQLAAHDWGSLVMGKSLLPYTVLAGYYQRGLPLAQAAFNSQEDFTCLQGSALQGTILDGVVVLTRAQENQPKESTWNAISKGQVVASLWGAMGLPLTNIARHSIIQWLPRAVKTLQWWQLSLGTDDVRECLRKGLPTKI